MSNQTAAPVTAKQRIFTTKVLTRTAILGAVAFVLMLMEISIPLIPSFYKLDFSEMAVLIGGFAMGPIPAVAIEAIKIVLNLLFNGTTTAYIGEIANFLIGICFVVPAAIIYQHHKSRQSAIKGMVIGTLCMTVAGVLLNYFVLLNAYSYFYHLDMNVLIGMGSTLIPAIKDKLSFVLLATTPFNLLKGIVVSVLTMLIYKHISPLLHR